MKWHGMGWDEIRYPCQEFISLVFCAVFFLVWDGMGWDRLGIRCRERGDVRNGLILVFGV